MPTEPVIEPLPVSWEPVERQMVDLFFDRVPFGLAVFDLEGRLQRCNRTWTGFYELYFGAGPDYTAPGTHINDLIPGNEAAIEQLFDAVRAGHVVRQAAHKIEIPGVTTYWDVVFAPLFENGELVGVLDVVTDATDRVQSTERLEARIRAFTHVAAAMTVDQPLHATLRTDPLGDPAHDRGHRLLHRRVARGDHRRSCAVDGHPIPPSAPGTPTPSSPCT